MDDDSGHEKIVPYHTRSDYETGFSSKLIWTHN